MSLSVGEEAMIWPFTSTEYAVKVSDDLEKHKDEEHWNCQQCANMWERHHQSLVESERELRRANRELQAQIQTYRQWILDMSRKEDGAEPVS